MYVCICVCVWVWVCVRERVCVCVDIYILYLHIYSPRACVLVCWSGAWVQRCVSWVELITRRGVVRSTDCTQLNNSTEVLVVHRKSSLLCMCSRFMSVMYVFSLFSQLYLRSMGLVSASITLDVYLIFRILYSKVTKNTVDTCPCHEYRQGIEQTCIESMRWRQQPSSWHRHLWWYRQKRVRVIVFSPVRSMWD